ncbi:Uncharacterised protein r2_g1998 [Pycnogonum litorale]
MEKGNNGPIKNSNHTTASGILKSLTHGLLGRWVYLLRTMPETSTYFTTVENAIRLQLIPALTGRPPPTDNERELMELPTRDGGLGIIGSDLSALKTQYTNSRKITMPLIELIKNQNIELGIAPTTISEIKLKVRSEKFRDEKMKVEKIRKKLPAQLQRTLDLAAEKGASSWLTALPIRDHGFTLHKSAFRDALCLRYGWIPKNLPMYCECGNSFTIQHALSCSKGGFPIMRHNEIRDMMASLLKDLCHDVSVEPPLQPLTGELFPQRSTNTEDLARLDIKASGFYGGPFDTTFLDVRVFNPHARTYEASSLSNIYRKQEMEKRRKYERRVREVEHGSFIPFVLSCTGGMGPAATGVVKRMASMMAEKSEINYSTLMAWIRCRLSYAMLRSSLICLRGARSTFRPVSAISTEAELVVTEAEIF